jgi:hypothetical protein
MQTSSIAALALVLITAVSASETKSFRSTESPWEADDPPFPLVAAQECRARTGLPNFLAKTKIPGAEIKVAYLGGSITEQPGWRPKTLAYFQKSSKARVRRFMT